MLFELEIEPMVDFGIPSNLKCLTIKTFIDLFIVVKNAKTLS